MLVLGSVVLSKEMDGSRAEGRERKERKHAYFVAFAFHNNSILVELPRMVDGGTEFEQDSGFANSRVPQTDLAITVPAHDEVMCQPVNTKIVADHIEPLSSHNPCVLGLFNEHESIACADDERGRSWIGLCGRCPVTVWMRRNYVAAVVDVGITQVNSISDL